MTLAELRESIETQIGDHQFTYCSFEPIAINSALVLGAVKQTIKAVMSVEAGLSEAKDHCAEGLLLAILLEAKIAGY